MVELETEGEMTRSEVTAFLREFIDELEDGSGDLGARADRDAEASHGAKQLTFVIGGDSATVTVPNTVDFEVEVESRSPLFSSGVKQEIEFELSWEVEEPAGDDESIEMV